MREMREDLYYSAKLVAGVLSGYRGLKVREGEEWVVPTMWDDPYYTCLQFENGRHLPLPLALEGGESTFPLQNFLLGVLRGLGCFRLAKADAEAIFDNPELSIAWTEAF